MKIVIYNPKTVYDHLHIEHPLKYIEGKRCLIDRTGKLPHWADLAWVEPLPEVGNFNKSFEQCVMERAESLVKTGANINVMWSGGIDSTVVLLAMFQVCEPRKLRIILNHDSILESGTMFEMIRKLNIKYHLRPVGRISELFKQPFFQEKRNIFVSGSLGDQLYGMSARYDLAQYMKPWVSAFDKKFVDYFEPLYYNSMPLVEFIHQWSLNFNWQALKYDFLRQWPQSSVHENFYGTEDFQRWSLSQDAKEDPLFPFRYPSRVFIAKHSGDCHYALNKRKASSLYGFNIHWLYYTSEGELVNA